MKNSGEQLEAQHASAKRRVRDLSSFEFVVCLAIGVGFGLCMTELAWGTGGWRGKGSMVVAF